jgi:uncharacterized protein DUF998
VRRAGPIVLAGIGAALINNYWVIEGLLARRTDPTASWISDLAARTEAFGWRFEVLEIASGVAVVAFGLALLPKLGRLSPLVRWGLWALVAEGVLTIVGGAAPLSCAESLDPSCSLNYDTVDVVHAAADILSSVATVLAFGWLYLGLIRISTRRGAAQATLAIGVVWLALTLATGVSYANGDVDAVKGLLQRAGQVAFGIWLVLLGWWASTADHGRQPVGDGGGDGVGILE